MKQIFALCLMTVLGGALNAKTVKHADFVVSQDGTGHFRTLTEAVAALPDYYKDGEIRVLIRKGIYREKVHIPRSKQFIRFIGEDADSTIISWDDFAQRNNLMGKPMGTSATATLFIDGDNLVFENLTIENTAGEVGQAVAVLTTGTGIVFERCRLQGNQDTLYTMQGGTVLRFTECYIEGTTDFIFGASTALFERCTIHSKRDSYITAASTPEGAAYGYVFIRCLLTADAGVTKVYLGRPWRPFARTVFIGCELGAHIRPEGWHNWSKPDAERTTFYAEYNNSGPGALTAGRAVWSHQLTEAQAASYTPADIIMGTTK